MDIVANKEITADDFFIGTHSYRVGENAHLFYLTLDDDTETKYKLCGTKMGKSGEPYLISNCAIDLKDGFETSFNLKDGFVSKMANEHTIYLWWNNKVVDSYSVKVHVYDSGVSSPEELLEDMGDAMENSIRAVLAGVAIMSLKISMNCS